MKSALAIAFSRPQGYASIASLQDELVTARQQDRIPDLVLILEHKPVVTLGVRARQDHVLIGAEDLRRKGIDMADSPRGGDVTYHAPGQLVLYPILKLTGDEADAHDYVSKLEEVAIRTAAQYGIAACRRTGKTGAWTPQGKLAAIGVRIRRWVTSHGMSLNVNIDLAGFNLIIPCGLPGEPVTSMESILGGNSPSLSAVRGKMLQALSDLTGRQWSATDPVAFLREFRVNNAEPI
jgi:lipoyl(octanoyl) transferase